MTTEEVIAYKCHCGAVYQTFESAISCAPCGGCGKELPIVSTRHLRLDCDGCRKEESRRISNDMAEAREAKDLAVPFVEVEISEEDQQWMVDDQFVLDLDDWMYDAPRDTDFSKTLVYNTRCVQLGAPYSIIQAAETVNEHWSEGADDWTPDPVGGQKFDDLLDDLIKEIVSQAPKVFYAITTGRIDMAAYAKDYYERNPSE